MVTIVWSTPPTFSDGNLLTASQLNTLSSDLNETAVAKAGASGRYVVSAGVKSVAERIPGFDVITTGESNPSTSYVNLTTIGPTVGSLVTGPLALVIIGAVQQNNTVNAETYASVVIGGATTNAANDPESMRHTSATANAMVSCSWAWMYTVTAGSNDFRIQYRVSSGTGTWTNRRIMVHSY